MTRKRKGFAIQRSQREPLEAAARSNAVDVGVQSLVRFSVGSTWLLLSQADA